MKNRFSPVAGAIALNAIFGNSPKFSHHLIDTLGSAEAVFALSAQERLRLFGPYNDRAARIGPAALQAAQDEYEHLSRCGVQFLSIFDEGYPALLRDCPDAPLLLYVRSATPADELFRGNAVSIVGTRDQSLYGRETCRRIVRALSRASRPPAVVSGLAIGVDITAHAAALDFGLPTIGVSPVGIDEVYPRRHAAFVERMCATPGCALVTDYPPRTFPAAYSFLRRNRIIAGLSGATVLVESRIKGGGMMTARLAAGYGREVFAVPGRIDDLRSQGCNHLIQDQLAAPVGNPDELPDQLGLGSPGGRRKEDWDAAVRRRLGRRASPQELEILVRILQRIRSQRGISLEELCRDTGLAYADAARAAGMLEEEGFIQTDLLQRCTINIKNA